MIDYCIPLELYPNGYYCDPKLSLPFAGIASQKNFIAFYHMGIYASPELLKWLYLNIPNIPHQKLDMGKSCIRFKEPEHSRFRLVGELMEKRP